MNVTASKLLLGISLAAYTYGSWDYLFTSREKPPEASKPHELTSAMVNQKIELSLGRDPFDSIPLERGAVASGAIGAGAGAGGDDTVTRELKELTLQAILLMPMGRVALVNGKQLAEGQQVQLEPGTPTVRAKKVGEDFVVIEGGGRIVMLRLESATGDKPAANSAVTGTGGRAQANAAANSPPPRGIGSAGVPRGSMGSARPGDR